MAEMNDANLVKAVLVLVKEYVEREQAMADETLCLDNEGILWQLESTLREMRISRPGKRSERSRRYAITITEMEKVVAYFKMFVVDR